jgi:hypothetical protein
VKRKDIRIGESYYALRPEHEFPKLSSLAYKPWRVEAVETGVMIETGQKWEADVRAYMPTFKASGVLVRDEDTQIEYTIASIDVIRTWDDHEARTAERERYDAQCESYEAERKARLLDQHLSVISALTADGRSLDGVSDELREALAQPTSSYNLSPDCLIELLGLLGAPVAQASQPAAEYPANPLRDTSPPQEYKSARGRERQVERFLTVLGILHVAQCNRDDENERGIEVSFLGHVPDYASASTDDDGNEIRQIKFGISPWIGSRQIIYRCVQTGMSEAAVRRTLTEMSKRDLITYRCYGAGSDGWRVTAAGDAMLRASTIKIPDTIPVS